MNEIVNVTYLITSGPILPELQWTETYILNSEAASFTRTGKVKSTRVNEGYWQIPMETQALKSLFSSLQPLDCRKLKREEPSDLPDGSGSETFVIKYKNGDTCEMGYLPGVSYGNGDKFSEVIRMFIKEISLPKEASAQYYLPSP